MSICTKNYWRISTIHIHMWFLCTCTLHVVAVKIIIVWSPFSISLLILRKICLFVISFHSRKYWYYFIDLWRGEKIPLLLGRWICDLLLHNQCFTVWTAHQGVIGQNCIPVNCGLFLLHSSNDLIICDLGLGDKGNW